MKPKAILSGAVLLLGCGCAQVQTYPSDTAPEYITSKATPFYRYGPQQPGRSEELAELTTVRLRSKESGFSQVELSDQRTGYVANDDIRPAPPSAPAVFASELFPERVEQTAPPEPDLRSPVAEVPVDLPKKKAGP